MFLMPTFFEAGYKDLIHRPNGRFWSHSMPLPDGNRIAGAHADRDVQRKFVGELVFEHFRYCRERSTRHRGKRRLFHNCALLVGAGEVTAINTADWPTYPENLLFASKQWNVTPDVVVDDFQTYPFGRGYDAIFFFGVLYHLENIFAAVRRLRESLNDGGTLFLETQMSLIESSLPIFEAASDFYPTIAEQDKKHLHATGIGNFLFPNEAAMHNLAYSYDFTCERLKEPTPATIPAVAYFD